jgi:hypothetical protein
MTLLKPDSYRSDELSGDFGINRQPALAGGQGNPQDRR